jgi:hypothetical protein
MVFRRYSERKNWNSLRSNWFLSMFIFYPYFERLVRQGAESSLTSENAASAETPRKLVSRLSTVSLQRRFRD